MTYLLQSERSWRAERAEVGRKSPGPKIAWRGGSPKIARVEGSWPIFGEPEGPKPWRYKNVAILTQQKVQPRIPNSAQNQISRKWQTFSYLLQKNEENWELLLVFTMTSAASMHQTYLCSIFVFAFVPLHMLFKNSNVSFAECNDFFYYGGRYINWDRRCLLRHASFNILNG